MASFRGLLLPTVSVMSLTMCLLTVAAWSVTTAEADSRKDQHNRNDDNVSSSGSTIRSVNSQENGSSAGSATCKEVAYVYRAKGLRDQIPNSSIPGESLRFCSSASTCCTPQLEEHLSRDIKTAFSEGLRKDFGRAKQKMASRTAKFDEFFQSLISRSQIDFNEMFRKTYGIQYEQNTDLFQRMFDSLRKYYTQGGVNLAEKMNDFFVELYQKMFLVLNSQYSITQKYLDCVGGTMKDVQPFKEVPEKLIQQITRSFVATRVFVQALGVGRDVLAILNDRLEPSSACVQAISKMHVCPQCNGFPDVKPCPAYCEVMVGDCLADVVKMNALWSKFIDTMINLAGRMEKQFNIEEVVEPIDLKISEAIMNFQESHEESIKMIYKQCGNPQFRSSSSSSSSGSSNSNSGPNGGGGSSGGGGQGFHGQKSSLSFPSGLSSRHGMRTPRSPVSQHNWPEATSRRDGSRRDFPLRSSSSISSLTSSSLTGGSSAAYSSGSNHRSGAMESHGGGGGGGKKRKDNNGLEKHIEAIKKQLHNMRLFFTQLPQRLCNAANNRDSSPVLPDSECWNGSEKTRNINLTSGLAESAGGGGGGPTRLRPAKPSKAQRGLVARQMDLLKIIIKKLQLAYDGKSVELGAVEDDDEADSGSERSMRSDLEGSGDIEGSGGGYGGGYPGSGDGEPPHDPDVEGGDDDDGMRPSHPASSQSSTDVASVTTEDLYFASPTTASPPGSSKNPTSPSAKPGTKRRKKKKNGAQKAAAEASSAWHLGVGSSRSFGTTLASLFATLALTHTFLVARWATTT